MQAVLFLDEPGMALRKASLRSAKGVVEVRRGRR